MNSADTSTRSVSEQRPESTPGTAVVDRPTTDVTGQEQASDSRRNAPGPIVLVILCLALLLRVPTAAVTCLSSDEVLRLMAVRLPYAAAVYLPEASVPQPLYDLLLRFWPGTSDFLLRLPSLLAGIAALWCFFLWMRMAFGRQAAVFGTLMLSFLPQVVARTSEVQAHPFLFLFVAAALYFLERTWRTGSVMQAGLCSLALALGGITYQSGLWVTVALGIYIGVRTLQERPARKVVVMLGAGLLVALLAGILLCPHPAVSAFRFGQDGIVSFLLTRTYRVFLYLFPTRPGAWAGLALFLAGAIAPAIRRKGLEGERTGSSNVLLLLAPFVVSAVASMFGPAYYGASPHSFILVVFAVAGASVFLARLGKKVFWPALTGVAVMLLAVNTGDEGVMGRWRWAARATMVQAVKFIQGAVPGGSLIFTDTRTQVLLQRYLPGPFQVPFETGDNAFLEVRSGGYHLVSPLGRWNFSVSSFDGDFARLSETYQAERGARVCVVTMGVGSQLAYRLKAQPQSRQIRLFGPDIAVFPMPVLGDGLYALAQQIAQGSRQKQRAVFWPTRFLDDWTREVVRPLADEVVSYEKLYQAINRGGPRQLIQRLPAWAFWAFGTQENHPEYMRYMDEAEDFNWGALSFELVEMDESGVAGVYLIDAPAAAGLDSLVPVVPRVIKTRTRFIFWPTDYLTDRARRSASRLSGDLLSYDELYKQLRSRKVDMTALLPALAFWEFGTQEWHPDLMRYMENGENYVSSEYSFTYLGADPRRTVGLYLIEPYAGEPTGR